MNQKYASDKKLRKHSRFSAQDDAFIMLGNRVAKITDISMGGLAFEYLSDDDENKEDSQLDIFMSENEVHISDIPCRVVYDMPVTRPYIYQIFSQTFTAKKCGVEFGILSQEKSVQLYSFLKNHTAELKKATH